MSYRFDETDSVLVCDRVKIPWERVFLHNDAVMSRRIYIETPANCYQNHQSNIRFWSKMGLIVGVASRICQANGTDKIPAVREVLGRLASLEALIGGLVQGQIEAWEAWPEGFATPNRRIMYAALNWCQEHHTEIIDILRTLLGGYPLVMPASIDVDDRRRRCATDSSAGGRRRRSRRSSGTSSTSSPGTWSASEFAGRHMLYEKFYAGSSIVVRNQSDREAPWERFHATVDRLLARHRRAGQRSRAKLIKKISASRCCTASRVGRGPLCGTSGDGTLAANRGAMNASPHAFREDHVIRKLLPAAMAVAAALALTVPAPAQEIKLTLADQNSPPAGGRRTRCSHGSSRSRRPPRAGSRSRSFRRRP